MTYGIHPEDEYTVEIPLTDFDYDFEEMRDAILYLSTIVPAGDEDQAFNIVDVIHNYNGQEARFRGEPITSIIPDEDKRETYYEWLGTGQALSHRELIHDALATYFDEIKIALTTPIKPGTLTLTIQELG